MLSLGTEGEEISVSHGKCVGHNHMERREQEIQENIVQLPQNWRTESQRVGLKNITSAKQGWETCSSTQSCPEALGEAGFAGFTLKIWDVSSDF